LVLRCSACPKSSAFAVRAERRGHSLVLGGGAVRPEQALPVGESTVRILHRQRAERGLRQAISVNASINTTRRLQGVRISRGAEAATVVQTPLIEGVTPRLARRTRAIKCLERASAEELAVRGNCARMTQGYTKGTSRNTP
jgi:hypothetical protein